MDKEKDSLLKEEESAAIETIATVFADGKAKNARVRRDANGNVVYVGLSDKILGIF